MKKILVFVAAALAFAGCGMFGDSPESDGDFISTGCASETKAGIYNEESELRLEYTPGGLLVTRKNAEMNCSIKDGGIDCRVKVENDVIGYMVESKSEVSASCSCLVKEMSSTVTDLVEGREYTLYYYCVDEMPLVPITFTYDKGLVMVIDTDLYTAELVEAGDGSWRPNVPYWW